MYVGESHEIACDKAGIVCEKVGITCENLSADKPVYMALNSKR